MSKTLIDIDDELLIRTQQIFGTSTKKDTVNTALREIVRRDAAKELVRLARSGAFGSAPNGNGFVTYDASGPHTIVEQA